jgi:hypothetical protein
MSFIPDRSKFKDNTGKYITQNLFLEFSYDTEKAVYTFNDEDKEYKGVVYPSLRKLYLETADPTEYEFACKYLWGWEHWQRIVANKVLKAEIDKWRDELEVKLRSKGVKAVLAITEGSFNAAKWAADGGWDVKRGRPSKEEKERSRKLREAAIEETKEESARVLEFIRKETK